MVIPLIEQTIKSYQPSAIILQCGADSLAHDKLGKFNLTPKGHSAAIACLRHKNIPLVMLGGGGYSIGNVARCWTYETATALGEDVSDDLPYFSFLEYFGPSPKLHFPPKPGLQNQNTQQYLHNLRENIDVQLKKIEPINVLAYAPDRMDINNEIEKERDSLYQDEDFMPLKDTVETNTTMISNKN